MRRLQLGMVLGALAIAGCEVSVGECDRDDAGRCESLFPDDEDAGGLGGMDSGADASTGSDGGTTSDAGGDAALGPDAVVPFDGGMDASSVDATVPTTLTPLAFCEAQYAAGIAWRDLLNDPSCNCVTSDPTDRDGMEAFLRDVLRFDNAIVSNCATGIDRFGDAGVTYDGTKAAACAAAYAAQFKRPEQFMAPTASCPGGFDIAKLEAEIGHGLQLPAQLPQCRAALAGTKGLNAVCGSDFECSGGLRCRSVPGGGENACRSALASGDTCTGSDDCADGLVCALNVPASGGTAAQSTCIPVAQLKAQTGNCSASSQCIVGLICDDATNKCIAPPADRICE